MIKTSESIAKLATALNAAQREIKGAVKDSANPFFKSRYADLESVIEAIQPIYAHGLSFVQMSGYSNNGDPVIVTRILHISGEWIEGYFPIVVKEQNNPQALGSSVTYSRRYSLAAAFGVPAVDDDAESAMGRMNPALAPKPYQAPNVTPTKATVNIPGATKNVNDAKAAVDRLQKATIAPQAGHEHKWMKSKYAGGDDWCGVKGCSARRPADNIL